MGPLAGALVSAGTSLLGGLFNKMGASERAKREEAAIREANRVASEQAAAMNVAVRRRASLAAKAGRKASRIPIVTTIDSKRGVDMDAFMSAAEDYGFNPLTFLRSGALSEFGFSHETQTVRGSGAMAAAQLGMEAALAGQHLPQLSAVLPQTQVPGMGEVLGGAITNGGNTFVSMQQQERQNEFQMQMLGAQLKGAMDLEAFKGSRFGNVPRAFLSGDSFSAQSGQPALSTKKSGREMCFGSICWDTAGGTSAQDAEDWYHELGGFLFGVGNIGRDAGKAARDWYKKMFKMTPEDTVVDVFPETLKKRLEPTVDPRDWGQAVKDWLAPVWTW